MIPAGIKPVTFRFVAQQLNYCAVTVPSQYRYCLIFWHLSDPAQVGLMKFCCTIKKITFSLLFLLTRFLLNVVPLFWSLHPLCTIFHWFPTVLCLFHLSLYLILVSAQKIKVIRLLPDSGILRGEGFGGFKAPPEIPKALQTYAKLNPIVKTVRNCWI